MIAVSKKFAHEVALGNVKVGLIGLGYVVTDIHEPFDEEKDDPSPDLLAFFNYLGIEIAGYKTVHVKADYVCIDVDNWEYSETELNGIGIIVHKEIASKEKLDHVKLSKEEFEKFRVTYTKIFEMIKALGFHVRLHLTFSVRVSMDSKLLSTKKKSSKVRAPIADQIQSHSCHSEV
jgi:hypothetical protein